MSFPVPIAHLSPKTVDRPRPSLRIPRSDTASWVVTAVIACLASAIRLSDLDRANSIIFDETYYVKDAWSLETLGYEGTWAEDQNGAFAGGDTSGLSADGSFIVHPPVGKWLIGLGMRLFGQSNPVGWRIATAIMGIIAVVLVCRLAWHLFSSLVPLTLTGLFLATDGMAVTLSRTGLLDGILATFVLGAYLAVAKDHKWARRRLGEKDCALLWRPWLLVAGVLLGLACGTKWSGIYAVAVLGIFVVVNEAATRIHLRHPSALWKTIFPDGFMAFFYLVVVAALVYVSSWIGWLLNPKAWGRGDGNGLAALWNYHQQMWDFHNSVTTPHNYQSSPLGWLFQTRPTSFAFEHPYPGCNGGDCVSAILCLGNPLLWWAGVAALALLLVAFGMRQRWQLALIFCGFLAMYFPWLLYLDRTVFSFYTVAFSPFVALVVAWALTAIGRKGRTWAVLATLVAIAILGSAIYFAPLWTGYPIPYDQWQQRMWLDGWI